MGQESANEVEATESITVYPCVIDFVIPESFHLLLEHHKFRMEFFGISITVLFTVWLIIETSLSPSNTRSFPD